MNEEERTSPLESCALAIEVILVRETQNAQQARSLEVTRSTLHRPELRFRVGFWISNCYQAPHPKASKNINNEVATK